MGLRESAAMTSSHDGNKDDYYEKFREVSK